MSHLYFLGSTQEIAALLKQPDVCVDCLDQVGKISLFVAESFNASLNDFILSSTKP